MNNNNKNSQEKKEIIQAQYVNEEIEYTFSSNAIFHFMEKEEYLLWILKNKGLAPRYCEENIKYLSLSDYKSIDTVKILQKCFCDIPLHNITKHQPIEIIGENKLSEKEHNKFIQSCTHTGIYGKYGIGFRKSWGVKNNLQPIHYVSRDQSSYLIRSLKKVFQYVISQKEIDDLIVEDILLRIAYYKPLCGVMKRIVSGQDIIVRKNFYDECEWRYVPPYSVLKKHRYEPVIFKESIQNEYLNINNNIQKEKLSDLWLKFEYLDILYIIVPNNNAREKIIKVISELEDQQLKKTDKYLLISKILVLDEIEKDW